jgi:hypothetical protein
LAVKLTRAQVNAWRLARHHLTDRAARGKMAAVVSDVCGIQAQVLSAAELAVRARVEGVRQQDVRDALWKDHTLLKTWCMRGSVHVIARSDLPLYVAALKTRLAESTRWLQKDGRATQQEIEAITNEIGKALAIRELTREQLSVTVEGAANLSPRTRRYLRSAWGVLLRPAAYQGMLAFGKSIGPCVTFVRPDLRGLQPVEWSTSDALLELFHRFLRSYGPATIGDFTHWWGSLGDGDRSTLRSSQNGLEEVELDGRRGLMLKQDAETASGLAPAHVVRLLPSFDCYVMLYSPRELFVSDADRAKIFRPAGWNYPVIMVDGAAAGTWGLRKRGKKVDVELEPFRPLSTREKKGVEEEVEDTGEFLGASGVSGSKPL